MKKGLWIITLVGAGIGFLILLFALLFAAPIDVSTYVVVAVAFSVIPYIAARSFSEIQSKS